MGGSEGTNPCTRPSFATKNVFHVLQDLSESIGGSPGPQLDAADGLPEPFVHDLHQSLIELLERPEILSLHAVRRVGCERQLHLKVRALCGEVEKVFNVLVDTGAQVSLVKCNRARALAPWVLLVLVFGGHFSEPGVVRRLLEGWVSPPLEFNTYPFPLGTCLGATSLFLSHVDLFTPCLFR